jgi:hypothetical protein
MGQGLSKAGYATDPKYADKLIRIIEDNQLNLLDLGSESIASFRPNIGLGSTLIVPIMMRNMLLL